jgi:hypothetical protein
MSNPSLILIGTGLLAVSIFVETLHADRPPERDAAPAASIEPAGATESTEDSPTPANTPAPAVLDDLQPDPLPDLPVTLPAPAAPTPEVLEPAEIEEPIPAATPPDPQLATVPPAPPLVTIESGPPPLRKGDLDALANRLLAIEENMMGQQQRALELVVSSNRTALIVAGIFAGVGVLAILIAALVLGRILNRFSDLVMAIPAMPPGGRTPTIPWQPYEALPPSSGSNMVEHVSARFLGAIEQLEKRIRELEQLPQSPGIPAKPANGASTQPSATTEGLPPTNGPTAKPLAGAADQELERRSQAEALLVEGENLLQQDRYEEALDRLEDVLALEPSNAEALIKRGMALERLQRMEAALESYDRAIASNGSLTLAYLHKGAVCNRLQRYREALECYERALQTEHKA